MNPSFQKKFGYLDHTRIRSPIQLKEFRFFIAARFFITFSFHSLHVTVSWQILELTNSPLALGLLGAIEFVPNFILAFFGGHLADRYSKRKILLFCISGILLCSIILFIFSLDLLLIKSKSMNVSFIYGIMILVGMVRGFYAPAALSFMSSITPQRLYPKSSAWNSAIWQTASMTGPAIGGLLYAQTEAAGAHCLNVVLLGISFGLMFCIQTKGILEKNQNSENFLKGIRKGLKFVYKQRALSGALLLDLFAVLFGGAVALLPIFADTILKTGPAGLGFLRAAPAVGAFLTAIFLVRRPPLKNTGRTLLYSVCGFGFCMFLFAFSENFYLSLFLLFISGIFDSVSVIVRSTMVQILTPDNMRGRVAAINFIFITSSNELGALESGVSAHLLGTVNSVWIGGFLTQAVVVFIAYFFPELRKLEICHYKNIQNEKSQGFA